jgi:SAM-dependent methyltransferase
MFAMDGAASPFMTTLWWISALALALVAVRAMRSTVYDFFIIKMTKRWYRLVLERVDANTRLLDIGIGTGTALAHNQALVASKRVTVVGIEYEPAYVERCERTFRDVAGLRATQCAVVCASVYDYRLGDKRRGGGGDADGDAAVRAADAKKSDVTSRDDAAAADGKFDAAYFSGSLMIMPDPAAALTHVASLVVDDGPIYITQTFQSRRNALLERVKPLLKFVTTIDFGAVTYETEFDAMLADAGFDVRECVVIDGAAGVGAAAVQRRAMMYVVVKKQPK